MIDREHKLSITQQAQLLSISRSAAYYTPRPISEIDLSLMRRLDELHLEYPFMGSRMLRQALLKEGFVVGRKKVTALMALLDIASCAPKPGT